MEEKYTTQILAYLKDQLPADDKAAFEQAMATDKTLAEEVQLYEDLYDVHEVIGDEELTATIQGAGDAYFNKVAIAKSPETIDIEKEGRGEEGKSVSMKWVLGMAAGFLLLLAVGAWWIGRNYSDEALAMNSFADHQITSFVRSPNNQNDPFASGLTALNEHQYQEAISFFTSIKTNPAFSNEATLYLALAQFKAGDYAGAQSNARIVMENSSQFSPKAKWLLVNVLLAQNGADDGEFQRLLGEMARDDGNPYYQKSALQLQQDLTTFWRRIVW